MFLPPGAKIKKLVAFPIEWKELNPCLDICKEIENYRQQMEGLFSYTPSYERRVKMEDGTWKRMGESLEMEIVHSVPDFTLLELFSMKEILENNPEAKFTENGNLTLDGVNHLHSSKFSQLGDIIKVPIRNWYPDWAIKRNLGR